MRRYIVFFLICASLLIFGQPTLASSPLILPSGFIDELVVGGLLAPRAFVFTPDGRILIAERGKLGNDDINFASIRVFKNGALLNTRAIELNVCGDSERGFLGMALDPNFTSNGYIYVYYTRQAVSGAACAFNTYTNPPNASIGPRNRVSRLTMVGDTINPASEKILIDNIITDVGYHNAGDLHFDSQGYLYATAGDGGLSDNYPTTTQNTDVLNGKMMRIKPDNVDPRGYVTTGNPYENASGARTCGTTAPAADPAPNTVNSAPCREVFASGLRNPFRFTIQSGTDIPFVGDVGGGAWEEVDKIVPGGNYGYPNREGPCPAGNICSPPFTPSGYNDPIYAYAHVAVGANSDSAIIGGDFYDGSGTPSVDYPTQYLGNYFFADFVRGFIRRLVYNAGTDSWSAAVPEFATGGTSLIGLKSGPSGNLYYVAFLDNEQVSPPVLHISEIRRIRYALGENQKPNAVASVNKFNGPVPGTVYTFSAAGSSDPDGNTPLQYAWDFGDGTTRTTSSLTTTYSYTTAVNRTVTLRVRDKIGDYSNPVTLTVYPGNIPATGTLILNNQTVPSRTTTYYAGDSWAFDAVNVVDPDNQTGDPSPTVSWSVVFHHRTHTHPFLPQANVAGSFQIPYQSFEPDPVVWFQAYLFITDGRSQVSSIMKKISPITSTITLSAVPAGSLISVGGLPFSAPTTLTRVVGMHLPVDAPPFQYINGKLYAYVSGPQLEPFVVPTTPTSFSAAYTVVPLPTRNYFQSEPVVLTWSAIDWATGYVVQIDDELSFIQPLHTSDLIPSGTHTYTAPTVPDGVYYWRVRAKKADGSFGLYSPAEAFTLVVGS